MWSNVPANREAIKAAWHTLHQQDNLNSKLIKKKSGQPNRCDRFSDVIPFEFNYVSLKDGSYINGSHINWPFSKDASKNDSKDDNTPLKYIATQSPTQNTFPTFIRMIYENNIRLIVTLGQCEDIFLHYNRLLYQQNDKRNEQSTQKDTVVRLDDLELKLVDVKDDSQQWKERIFEIKHVDDATNALQVTQLCFDRWPDHGVPESPAALITFMRRFSIQCWQNEAKNIRAVIHCVAGVGRTGTFCALDILLAEQARLPTKPLNLDRIVRVVSSLKDQRPYMVQTESQLAFLAECMMGSGEKLFLSA